MDGLNLIPVTIGLFAIPELISLVASGSSISKMELNNLDSGRRQGIRDSFTHWWLVIRSSLVGVWVGMIPGLGSSVADWFAYGHARATEKEQKRLSARATSVALSLSTLRRTQKKAGP